MAVAVEDVKAWFVSEGIGHAVAGPGIGSGWGAMACGMNTPCSPADVTASLPKRICKKCRARLAEPETRAR